MKSHFGMGVLLKFAAYFQSTFLKEHLWRAASDPILLQCSISSIPENVRKVEVPFLYFMTFSAAIEMKKEQKMRS